MRADYRSSLRADATVLVVTRRLLNQKFEHCSDAFNLVTQRRVAIFGAADGLSAYVEVDTELIMNVAAPQLG